MRFNLATIAYVFALLAAGMAVFGAGLGMLAAGAVLAFWGWMYYGPSLAAIQYAVAAVIILVLLALLFPAVQSAREAARSNSCMNNLKQIALGLLNHLDATGQFPAEATYDENGRPLHSWRTAILPYMEQQALHRRIALDKPWDDRSNRGWTISTHLDQYLCPSHYDSASTGHYFAVVGQRTMWPQGRGRKFEEVSDGPASTLLVIEAPWKRAQWAEPTDLTFEEAVAYLTRRPAKGEAPHEIRHGFFYKETPVVHAVTVDGYVRRLPLPLPRYLAEALLTVDGGEEIDEGVFEISARAELDYAKCYAFAAFVVLGLLPGIVRLVQRAKSRKAPLAGG